MVQRIGLLTLPLHTNYGGIIQIVALYQFLTQNGKQPVFLQKKPIRRLFQRLVARVLWNLPWQNIAGVRERERLRALHYPFIQRFMPNATKTLRSSLDLERAVQQHELEAVVVGSDQVWRFDYHGDAAPLAFFLDFVDPTVVRRISYAASFGHGSWKFPEHQGGAARLLSDFHAVSVREQSGVKICCNDLECSDVAKVLDPTLLVDPSFYEKAVASGKAFNGSTLLRYVLDQSETVQRISEIAQNFWGGKSVAIRSISPNDQNETIDIPHWIQAFRDADYVITDSFHGTVFAIIFKKPFVAIPNHERGLDRFTTLLDSLGLTSRLLLRDSPDEIASVLATQIDYETVSFKLQHLRADSAKFLLSALA